MSGLALITGSTGKTGRSLTALLKDKGVAYRAVSRGSGIPFDWSAPQTWGAALEDVGSVYLLAPAAAGEAYGQMIEFLKVAQGLGVRRAVLLSMASLPAGGPAQGLVHQWLIDNCDDWAVLAPSAFMQNFSEGPYLASIRDEDTIYSNTGEGHVPFISTADIAAAAFVALTSPAPLNRAFTLTGDAALSYGQVAERIGQACGRPITHTHITTPEMAGRLVARGVPEQMAALLAWGYQSIGDGAQERVFDDLRTLTGQAPVGFEAFAATNAGVWRKA